MTGIDDLTWPDLMAIVEDTPGVLEQLLVHLERTGKTPKQLTRDLAGEKESSDSVNGQADEMSQEDARNDITSRLLLLVSNLRDVRRQTAPKEGRPRRISRAFQLGKCLSDRRGPMMIRTFGGFRSRHKRTSTIPTLLEEPRRDELDHLLLTLGFGMMSSSNCWMRQEFQSTSSGLRRSVCMSRNAWRGSSHMSPLMSQERNIGAICLGIKLLAMCVDQRGSAVQRKVGWRASPRTYYVATCALHALSKSLQNATEKTFGENGLGEETFLQLLHTCWSAQEALDDEWNEVNPHVRVSGVAEVSEEDVASDRPFAPPRRQERQGPETSSDSMVARKCVRATSTSHLRRLGQIRQEPVRVET